MPATPNTPHGSDRELHCQMALEARFQDSAESAERGGWTGDEVASALVALALAHIKATVGKAAVDRAIKQARASAGEH